MSFNHYKVYLDQVLGLVNTLTIKSEDTANAMNNLLIELKGEQAVNLQDPTTWKYYKNICGEYHYSDSLIYITSLDTLEKIAFTKENLDIHTATKQGYLYGTRNYRELIEFNPLDEVLIKGIVYPANMQEAINAIDGTILAYGKYYVEENEWTLIDKLQTFIYRYKTRWHNPTFEIVDDLYPAAHHALLCLNLIPAIINIRLRACKTNEAHSFHIRMYLASHSNLDKFYEYMTRKQALFFYRNIAYIERNSGSVNTFKWLVDKIMTDRRLPIASLTMKHNQSNMPNDLLPTLGFRKKHLNQYLDNNVNVYPIEKIYEKEYPISIGNKDYITDRDPVIRNNFEYSLSSVVGTKMLESSMTDYTDSSFISLEEIMLNHWLYMTSVNKFNIYITIRNPRSGEDITLSSRDALIWMIYCYYKSVKIDLPKVPSFYGSRIQKSTKPTIAQLKRVVDSKYVSDDIAQEVLKTYVPLTTCYSKDAFYKLCSNLLISSDAQVGIISNQHHQYRRGLVHGMTNQMYYDKLFTFPDTGEAYGSWLNRKFLPKVIFSEEEYSSIYLQLFQATTGYDVENFHYLRNLQLAMTRLFKHLSSYSIQFITEINALKIKKIRWDIIRVGDVKAKVKLHYQFSDALVSVIDYKYTPLIKEKININDRIHYKNNINKYELSWKYEVPVRVKPVSLKGISVYRKYLIPFDLKMNIVGEPTEGYLKTALVGQFLFDRLTPEQKQTVPSMY